jgi:FtsZ-binding cell division protein ZapB
MPEDMLVPNQEGDGPVPAWATDEILPPIVIPPEHLEPIRDRWMRPLVDRIATLEREIGRLQSQHHQARRATDTALHERDEARRALREVTSDRDQLRSERDALLATRARLRDQMRSLEHKVRSAQDTTALRAIEAYDLPRQRSMRRKHSSQHRRGGWWPFGKRS